MNINTLLVNEEYIKLHSTISDNLDETILRASIRDAQMRKLMPLIGELLYDNIANAVDKGEIATNLSYIHYNDLLEVYIKPYLLWEVQSCLIVNNYQKQHNAGSVLYTDTNYQHTPLNELKYFKNVYEENASFYGKRLQEYLNANLTLYVEYRQHIKGGLESTETSNIAWAGLGVRKRKCNSLVEGAGNNPLEELNNKIKNLTNEVNELTVEVGELNETVLEKEEEINILEDKLSQYEGEVYDELIFSDFNSTWNYAMIGVQNAIIMYSYDNSTWNYALTDNQRLNFKFNEHPKLYVKIIKRINETKPIKITCDEKCNISGDLKHGYIHHYYTNCFRGTDCKVVDASGLILSSTEVAESAYQDMFMDNTYLTKPPQIKAVNIYGVCMRTMFRSTNITEIPDLSTIKTVNGDECMFEMFYNCSNLTDVSNTTLKLDVFNANHCMNGMFADCYNLQNTLNIDLSTTEMIQYYESFNDVYRGCTSLTTASVYILNGGSNYFDNCTSLQEITLKYNPNTDISTYDYWLFYGTAINKIIFYTNDNLSDKGFTNFANGLPENGVFEIRGIGELGDRSGLPESWTVVRKPSEKNIISITPTESDTRLIIENNHSYDNFSHFYWQLDDNEPIFIESLQPTAIIEIDIPLGSTLKIKDLYYVPSSLWGSNPMLSFTNEAPVDVDIMLNDTLPAWAGLFKNKNNIYGVTMNVNTIGSYKDRGSFQGLFEDSPNMYLKEDYNHQFEIMQDDNNSLNCNVLLSGTNNKTYIPIRKYSSNVSYSNFYWGNKLTINTDNIILDSDNDIKNYKTIFNSTIFENENVFIDIKGEIINLQSLFNCASFNDITIKLQTKYPLNSVINSTVWLNNCTVNGTATIMLPESLRSWAETMERNENTVPANWNIVYYED